MIFARVVLFALLAGAVACTGRVPAKASAPAGSDGRSATVATEATDLPATSDATREKQGPDVDQALCDSVPSCDEPCNQGDGAACYRGAELLVARQAGFESVVSWLGRGCRASNGPSCYELGRIFAVAFGPEKATDASALLARGCELDHAEACNSYGLRVIQGTGVPIDQKRGVELWKKACRLGSREGCENVAYRYTVGRGVDRDMAQAVVFGERGCSLGSGEACYHLATAHIEGVSGKPDGDAAIEAYRRGCELSNGRSCAALESAKKYGVFAPVDMRTTQTPEAFARRVRNCESGELLSCGLAGRQLEAGAGVAEDRPRAERLFRHACDGNHVWGCVWLGDFLTRRGETKERAGAGLSAYRKACDLGQPEGCARLGIALAHGVEGHPPQPAEARVHLGLACDGGDADGCWHLAYLLWQLGDASSRQRSFELYKTACDARIAKACMSVAIFHDSEILGARDMNKALRRYEQACSYGFAEGCEIAARIHSGGAAKLGGPDRDDAKAEEFRRRGKLLRERAGSRTDSATE